MNLNQLVSGAIAAVNPRTSLIIKRSQGYQTDEDGTRRPSYTLITTTAQVQAMSGTDIMRMNDLNIQGVMHKVYLNRNYDGVVRSREKGGDLFIFNNQVWLVVHVLENWVTWCALTVVLQNDLPSDVL